jgi:hypothetical protein
MLARIFFVVLASHTWAIDIFLNLFAVQTTTPSGLETSGGGW